MQDGMIRVNTCLMKQDIERMRRDITELGYQMEILEVEQDKLKHFWNGAAKEMFSKNFRQIWMQCESKKIELKLWLGKWEYMQNIYRECENRVMREIKALRV